MPDSPMFLKTWSCVEHPHSSNVYVKWDGHRVAHICNVCGEYVEERTFVAVDDLKPFTTTGGQFVLGYVT